MFVYICICNYLLIQMKLKMGKIVTLISAKLSFNIQLNQLKCASTHMTFITENQRSLQPYKSFSLSKLMFCSDRSTCTCTARCRLRLCCLPCRPALSSAEAPGGWCSVCPGLSSSYCSYSFFWAAS